MILDNGKPMQKKAPDTEIGNQEQNAVEDVTPKKKRGWRNTLSKLLTSCYKNLVSLTSTVTQRKHFIMIFICML